MSGQRFSWRCLPPARQRSRPRPTSERRRRLFPDPRDERYHRHCSRRLPHRAARYGRRHHLPGAGPVGQGASGRRRRPDRASARRNRRRRTARRRPSCRGSSKQILGSKYLRNPQVTVTVAASVSQKVSIQGEVREPGVYPLSGPTTLLGVISMAKGETEVASLKQVVVFRTSTASAWARPSMSPAFAAARPRTR